MMVGVYRFLSGFALSAALVFPASLLAEPTRTLAQEPLFSTQAAKHNLLMAMDNSRHMDLEFLMAGGNYGRSDRDTLNSWMGRLLESTWDPFNLAPRLIGDVQYGYLFEVNLAPRGGDGVRRYNGQRLLDNYFVVPPVKHFAFMRSSKYNTQYYDPSITYEPWSSPDGRYGQAPFGDPLLDPHYGLDFGTAARLPYERSNWGQVQAEIDFLCAPPRWSNLWLGGPGYLFRADYCFNPLPELAKTRISPFAFSGGAGDFVRSTNEALGSFVDGIVAVFDGKETPRRTTLQNAACTMEQVRLNATDFFNNGLLDIRHQCIMYVPATYYVPVTDAQNWGGLGTGLTNYSKRLTCAPNPEGAARYVHFAGTWALENTLTFRRSNGQTFDGALAPDGGCLEKVEINDRNRIYNKGTPYERTFEQELQNFSNWFQYHRNRHQSVRYATGKSIQNVDGVYAELMTVDGVKLPYDRMRDTDLPADLQALVDRVYSSYDDTPATNGSPLRGAVRRMGQLFDNGAIANPPITAECQKNYAMLISDGYNDNFDESFSIAELAQSFFRTRLRPDLPAGRVPVPSGCFAANPDPMLDCERNLHMNTFATLLGDGGSIFGRKLDGTHYLTRADAVNNPPEWPSPVGSGSLYQVDDVYRAVVEGKGEVFNARIPDYISQYLNQQLSSRTVQAGGAAAVTFNSALVESDTAIFAASFESAAWSGKLYAKELNSVNGRLVRVDDSYIGATKWEASEKLDSRTENSRVIMTKGESGAVPFRYANLSDAQKADLRAGGDNELGGHRLNYVRGERQREQQNGGAFRNRTSVLGDIIHSAPVYVDRPRMRWPDYGPFGVDGARYSHFRAAKYNRQPMVYVGANDGMLHAFHAETGEEVFAYVPGLVYDARPDRGLSYLTDPDYIHRYYVDLTPAVADVYINSPAAPASGRSWRTVLIGGLRAGGAGLFALDITNPPSAATVREDDSAMANMLLWEFNHPNLGYVTEPVNVMLVDRWGSDTNVWVAVFGNGYYAPQGGSGLFMVRLDNGQHRYIEVDSQGSGMTSDIRLVDLNGDGVPDRIYGGDLDGRVWAFENSSSGWRSAFRNSSGQALPLFRAQAPDATPQPITAAPMVVSNPYTRSVTNIDVNLLVIVGTGRYLTQSDIGSREIQSLYGVWDTGSSGGFSTLARKDLLKRTIDQRSGISSGSQVMTTRNLSDQELRWSRSANSSSGRYTGWAIDFDVTGFQGERVVQMPQVRNETIVVNTLIPPSEDDLCASNGGSFRMFVGLDGADPQRPVIDTNRDGQVNSDDLIVAGLHFTGGILSLSQVLGNVMFDNTAGGDLTERFTNENVVDFGGGLRTGRLSWRELIFR